jgi:coenzyme F420-0:L-glutamate ligase/coenzyme F420-1:gamma-L-glutamate ligase
VISLIGVSIDHRFGKGDDLTEIILSAIASCTDLPSGLQSGDILVITSKIIAKAEGRVIAAPDREDAITAETVRVVATKIHKGDGAPGSTRIVQNKHGLILAAAGVDASNTETGTVVLLPQDPDASARALRASIQKALGISIGVIVTDTLGRAWRLGVTPRTSGVIASDERIRRSIPDSANKLAVRLSMRPAGAHAIRPSTGCSITRSAMAGDRVIARTTSVWRPTRLAALASMSA